MSETAFWTYRAGRSLMWAPGLLPTVPALHVQSQHTAPMAVPGSWARCAPSHQHCSPCQAEWSQPLACSSAKGFCCQVISVHFICHHYCCSDSGSCQTTPKWPFFLHSVWSSSVSQPQALHTVPLPLLRRFYFTREVKVTPLTHPLPQIPGLRNGISPPHSQTGPYLKRFISFWSLQDRWPLH